MTKKRDLNLLVKKPISDFVFFLSNLFERIKENEKVGHIMVPSLPI